MSATDWSLTLPDEGRLSELARSLGRHLQAPLVVYLQGDLGAGKTTFARALIHALGYSGRVKSPTYGLLETYSAGGFHILHLDLYRIESATETDELAIRDLFDNKSVLLVEWPEKGAGSLPPADLVLQFGEDAGQRCVKLQPHTADGAVVAQATERHFKKCDF